MARKINCKLDYLTLYTGDWISWLFVVHQLGLHARFQHWHTSRNMRDNGTKLESYDGFWQPYYLLRNGQSCSISGNSLFSVSALLPSINCGILHISCLFCKVRSLQFTELFEITICVGNNVISHFSWKEFLVQEKQNFIRWMHYVITLVWKMRRKRNIFMGLCGARERLGQVQTDSAIHVYSGSYLTYKHDTPQHNTISAENVTDDLPNQLPGDCVPESNIWDSTSVQSWFGYSPWLIVYISTFIIFHQVSWFSITQTHPISQNNNLRVLCVTGHYSVWFVWWWCD